MFEIESLEEAAVAAALVTGPRHRLVQHNRSLPELFASWRPGQEAGVALTGPGLRPVLRALDLAGTDRSAFYTDGLVERPGTDISDGMRHLAGRAAGLRGPGLPLTGLVAALLPPPGEAADDIAVIAFRADDALRPP